MNAQQSNTTDVLTRAPDEPSQIENLLRSCEPATRCGVTACRENQTTIDISSEFGEPVNHNQLLCESTAVGALTMSRCPLLLFKFQGQSNFKLPEVNLPIQAHHCAGKKNDVQSKCIWTIYTRNDTVYEN